VEYFGRVDGNTGARKPASLENVAMRKQKIETVVAGHICLDIIPAIAQKVKTLDQLVAPGKLVDVGPAVISTGGAVSNTGLALHRLGIATSLMGKIGNDSFGRAILDVLHGYGKGLTDGMIIDDSVTSSYTVVINPPGIDRCFLHCPGANDTLGADDIRYDKLEGVRLFHFGYPPLMRLMYTQGGAELEKIARAVRNRGVTMSLDMALPDPASEAGRQDWVAILRRVLPHVDVFLPSFDEILAMLRPALSAAEQACIPAPGTRGGKGPILSLLAKHLIDLGCAIVVLKLGEEGLYLRTTPDRDRLSNLGACQPDPLKPWIGRELVVPCFRTRVVGTTGAGDCTIAGFLAGLLKGLPPDSTMTHAVGTGAFNVEQADATSGVPAWNTVSERIARGWDRLPTQSPGPGWTWSDNNCAWIGPADQGEKQS
jgi:sugar/nucleoside kinase (ribokinase family)